METKQECLVFEDIGNNQNEDDMYVKRSISTRIWSDAWIETLSTEAKLLWVYLLTNRETNILGIYEISIKRIAYETWLGEEKVLEILSSFAKERKAFYFDGTVFIPSWLKNQAPNTNMLQSAQRLYDGLPNELIIKINDVGFKGFESLGEALGKPLVSLSKGLFREIEKESEKEKEKESYNKEKEKEKEQEKDKETSGRKKRKPHIFVKPTKQDVINFFKEKGYNPGDAERAWEYYETADWIDSKGKPVLNWKQKMIANWLKPENKTVDPNQAAKDEIKQMMRKAREDAQR